MARLLVLSADPTLSRLMRLNLERRGFEVREHGWAACCGRGAAPQSDAAELVIADLDCPPPACWRGGPQLRAVFRAHPLLLVAHDRPSAAYLRMYQPCRSLQKPFAVDELVREVSNLFSTPD